MFTFFLPFPFLSLINSSQWKGCCRFPLTCPLVPPPLQPLPRPFLKFLGPGERPIHNMVIFLFLFDFLFHFFSKLFFSTQSIEHLLLLTGNSKIVGEYFFQGKLPILFERWRNEYGKIFMWVNYPLNTKKREKMVVIGDAKEMNRLMKINPPKPFHYEQLRLLGQGVLSQNNMAEWYRQRELLKPVFSVSSLKSLFPVIQAGSKELIEFLSAKADACEPFDFHEYINNLAFLMIGHSALGEESSFLKDRSTLLRNAFDVVLNKGFLGEDLQTDKEYKEADQVLRDFAHEVFSRFGKNMGHMKEVSAHSLIQVILGENQDGTPLFNDQQRQDQLSTFMFAGLTFLPSQTFSLPALSHPFSPLPPPSFFSP